MRKFINIVLGSTAGAILVAIGMAFLSPLLGDEVRQRFTVHYQRAMEAGRKAAAEKRHQLEQELAEMNQTEQDASDTT